ncbi:1-acyl-sn-glycerol-3-phosphate acyltransferase 1, chloroplastic-like [Momordica charantia]|uniref:1-acyl-sn-glycerol-3-phosphate acyltransferase n=1 Tax=Momordica charantia TaxID=3673 RepID=A0A6J1DW93_MOMCH|nr:1-acyl-sn-glycerol-3-phosphate acyltransferase 1, chloroplastic-like [Momordica charantia]XP_022156866.1 1-acyl-sn-glycerol-3-phosphate acyltransferase 1, chloroplastic-like [Momordica charantia]XP_022156867.1 1-acyl-sn-glycerol-3-phosphate acyltransferase 1, chloroplastic-like [Momordica charantia]XP_022156868.1 1-acyl-sn-glycerol-3-phosphate acyltransferase 1, chloroplastic-like [Momordica charantia]XP_022156869.1 1-acyl-sn-glycerol-3-phosphate acyltransferase 1, chloroplastic-like [Momord
MESISLPHHGFSLALHRYGYQELGLSSASSSLPMNAFMGLQYCVSLHQRANLRNVAQHHCFSSIIRKYAGVSWCYPTPNENLYNPWHNKLLSGKRVPRHIIVRSELAKMGIHEADYPLSEVPLGSKVRGMCFYATTAITAIFLFMLMLVAHPVVLLMDRYRRRIHYTIAKMWATLSIAPFFRIKYEGLENLPSPNSPAVYVSNHQSFLDIYTLLTLGRSFKFISKTTIFLFPIIGWAMFMMGVIPLKRMDSRSQLDCLKRCMELIRKGASVFFFPEGTRSKDGKLGAFKKGAFSVAAKTKVPVVPITLVGTGSIMPSGFEGILNVGSVKVIVHKVLVEGDPETLCNEARNVIADALSKEC